MRTCEIRFSRPEVRTDGRYISGHAAVFNTPADVGGAFLEQIRPGAFARALRERQDTKCLLNHNPDFVLGRVSNGTLALAEDSRGLHFRCDVSRTSAGDDALSMIRRGDLKECSFGFVTAKKRNGAAPEIARDASAISVRWLMSIC